MSDREFVSAWEPRWRAGPPADGPATTPATTRDATAAALYAVRRREPALSVVLDDWAEHDLILGAAGRLRRGDRRPSGVRRRGGYAIHRGR